MARGRVGRSCGHAGADVRDTGAIGGRVVADIGAYARRGHTGVGEGAPYNIQMAAWVSGSRAECVLRLFGNGVTFFSNPNRQ